MASHCFRFYAHLIVIFNFLTLYPLLLDCDGATWRPFWKHPLSISGKTCWLRTWVVWIACAAEILRKLTKTTTQHNRENALNPLFTGPRKKRKLTEAWHKCGENGWRVAGCCCRAHEQIRKRYGPVNDPIVLFVASVELSTKSTKTIAASVCFLQDHR